MICACLTAGFDENEDTQRSVLHIDPYVQCSMFWIMSLQNGVGSVLLWYMGIESDENWLTSDVNDIDFLFLSNIYIAYNLAMPIALCK